jgi:hypothetical protein
MKSFGYKVLFPGRMFFEDGLGLEKIEFLWGVLTILKNFEIFKGKIAQ